jgi:type IV pilus assembly protein PilC
MAKFAYEGRTSSGESRSGTVEADSVEAAKSRLRQMQISPTSVAKKGGLLDAEISIPTPAFMKPKVTTKDLVIFTRQFATMITVVCLWCSVWTFRPNRRRIQRFATSFPR